eukprot:7330833-Pyramimonas_sp.AAC.1
MKRCIADYSPYSPALGVPEVLFCPVCLDPELVHPVHRTRLLRTEAARAQGEFPSLEALQRRIRE